jgi:hypothetical protein
MLEARCLHLLLNFIAWLANNPESQNRITAVMGEIV